MDLTEIQKRLNDVACPMCNNSTLDVTLRCDLDYGECLATAKCQTCKTSYEVSTEKRVLETGKKDLGSFACPHCEADDVALGFRCELPSFQCFYMASCRKCSESFLPETVKGA